jgi:iron complex transport system substrate-binding protein
MGWVCVMGLAAVMSCGWLGGCQGRSHGGEGARPPQGQERIVVIGGAITEVVYGVGLGVAVVGVDSSSTYPPEVSEVEGVGYLRRVSAEGVLGLAPTLVLVTEEAGPEQALAQLREAGVRVEALPGAATVEGARARIRRVGELLGRSQEAAAMVEAMDAKLTQAAARVATLRSRPAVLLLYAHGAGGVHVFGRGTAADALLELIGARNAAAVEGVVPLSAEGVLAAAPDALLVPSSSVAAMEGEGAVWALPGMAQTPAGRAKRLVQADKLAMLGFGPRLGEVALALIEQLHGGVGGGL